MAQLYGSRHAIGRFRIMGVTGEQSSDIAPESVRKALLVEATMRNEAQSKILNEHFAQTDPETNKLRKQLDELRKKPPSHPQPTSGSSLSAKETRARRMFFAEGNSSNPCMKFERMASACCIRSNLETSIKPETGSTLPVGWLTRRTRSLRESSSTKRGPTSSDMGSYARPRTSESGESLPLTLSLWTGWLITSSTRPNGHAKI